MYTVFAPWNAGDLKTKFIVKETELPELVIVVKPTAHWLFWRVDADPMPLVFNVTPSLAYRPIVDAVRLYQR